MATTNWSIDPTHSTVGFKVKHMMFTNVKGNFEKYEATIVSNEADFTNATIEFSADINSVNTNNADRDKHLKGEEFFDADKFPKLTFKSTSFKKAGDDYEITGDLTFHGVTKSVTFPAEAGGMMTDPWGNTKAGLNISGKINRKDWGLTWNSALETGGVLVSEVVNLDIELELQKD